MHGHALMRVLFTALAFIAVAMAPARAQPVFDTKAQHAILIDFDSGTVLFEKAADEPTPPASMAKLMVAEYVFRELKNGRLSMDDEFSVSEYAWRTGGASSGGSTMFAQLNSRIRLEDLLRGMLVQSGNDASIIIAEGIAGSELAFADLMNRRAKEIGLENSVFRNATGLHDPEQHVTVRDLAHLARHIIREYPDLYKIFSEPEFTWNKITQQNRNPLLRAGIGADGLKTGYVKESGYGLTASAIANTQRLILSVNGFASAREREAETRKLMEWGFRSFRQVTVFDADEVVAEASVYGGEQGRVPLKANGPVRVLLPRTGDLDLKARAVYEGPLMAPVEAGKQVGHLRIWDGDRLIQETPLSTAAEVGTGRLHQRALDALGELLLGWL
ncbi:D-alanyl-D-alanine carboxypeptidase family protein [Faunimonas sp. B44]|uniref:D-alanyl-D-alanine carboxypeptidase family protein n=1 Tax=Faunimonas sp. B44 TaxID=3461493 RepID=UPI00404402AA